MWSGTEELGTTGMDCLPSVIDCVIPSSSSSLSGRSTSPDEPMIKRRRKPHGTHDSSFHHSIHIHSASTIVRMMDSLNEEQGESNRDVILSSEEERMNDDVDTVISSPHSPLDSSLITMSPLPPDWPKNRGIFFLSYHFSIEYLKMQVVN